MQITGLYYRTIITSLINLIHWWSI